MKPKRKWINQKLDEKKNKLISSFLSHSKTIKQKEKDKKNGPFQTDGEKSPLFLFVCEWSAALSRVWQAVAGAAGGILVLRRGQQPGAPTMAHEIRSSQVALLGNTPLPPSLSPSPSLSFSPLPLSCLPSASFLLPIFAFFLCPLL